MSENKYLMRSIFGLEFVSCRFLYLYFLRHVGARSTSKIEFH